MFASERQSRFAFGLGIAVLGLALVAAPFAATETLAFELGEAPRRDVSQDISGWQVPQQRIGIAATTRDTVVQLYNNVYLPGNAVALIWTGSVATCDPGTTNVAHQQAVIDRVNYFRALVELPPVTLLTGTPMTQAQASALMMSANNALDHFPPMTWLCYSADGATGAQNSNIALGINGVGSIDLYMSDPGAGNTAAGHRRWILFPPQASIGTGDVPRSGPTNQFLPANDLFVFGPTTTRPATPNGIAWPPASFVPYQNLPSGSNRWSFSFPGADFSGATVAMTGPGGSIPVTLETIQNGYGDRTIVFKPTGFPYGNPGSDTSYTILVSGMTGSGVPPSIQYTVTVIDPILAASPPVLGSVVSRRVHGAAGTFDLPLGIVATNPTTEPRQGPAFTIVFTFDKAVTAGTATVTVGTATVGAVTFSGNEMRIPLTNVADQQYVTVTVSNVASSDGGTGGGGSVRVGFLKGDANQNRVVTFSDDLQVNNVLGQPVTSSNYLKDLNANGILTFSDNLIVNNQGGRVLPAP